MECLLQYLDDLDDLVGMAGLAMERARRWLIALCFWLALGAGATAGIALALIHPPIALATSILLFVTLLYRSATSPAAKILA